MKVKELNKFNIKFIDASPNSEIEALDYAKTIRDAYFTRLKYDSSNKENSEVEDLKKEVIKVENTPIEFSIIKSIYMLENAFLNRRKHMKETNDFFIIETKNKEFLIYNMTTGENHTLDYNNSLGILLNISYINEFYKEEKNEIETEFSLNNNVVINLYKHVELKNIYSNETIKVKNLIDIHDDKDNKIFLDVDKRILYVRNNYDIKETFSSKKHQLFEIGKPIKYTRKVLSKLNFNQYRISNNN